MFLSPSELAANLTTIGTRNVAFSYNGKDRVGSIEKIQGGAVTLKHTITSTKRLGRPFAAYTLANILGKVAVQLAD